MEKNSSNFLKQLETTLDEYFGKKAPALPANVKEFIVKIAPYLVIVSLILTIPALFVLLGLGGLATGLAPFGGAEAVGSVPFMWLSILLLVPVIILDIMALPGLFSRKAVAWKYIFWGQLFSIVSSLVQFNLLGAIIGALIGFYILFQIRSYYK